MTQSRKNALRVEVNYAGVQASFWAGYCAYAGFMAVFLASNGFTDIQIGLTSALISAMTIVFQLFISSYSDAHLHIPLKFIIAILYAIAMTAGAVLRLFPLPLGLMMMVYAFGGSVQITSMGLSNAQLMQYINAGLPVNMGWPRGLSSVIYALTAYLLGRQIDIHSPRVLMPIFLSTIVISIALMLMMPRVTSFTNHKPAAFTQDKNAGRTTYWEILSRNKPLRLFLIAGVLLNVGQSTNFLFLVRVVQSVGGGAGELGIAMFLQAVVEMPALFVSSRILRRFRAGNVLVFSFCFYLIKGVLLLFARSISVVYLAMSLSMFCFGLFCLSSVYFVDSLANEGEKVRAQGMVALCGSVAGIVSTVMAGSIIETFGLKTLLSLNAMILLSALALMVRCNAISRQQGTISQGNYL